MAEMVYCQRHLITDHFPDVFHILLQNIIAVFRYLHAGKGVRNILIIIPTVSLYALRFCQVSRNRIIIFRRLFQFLHKSQRRIQRSRFIIQKIDPKIHFQERKALIHSRLQGCPHLLTGMLSFHIRICVDPYLITELSAQHLINRDTVSLARQIPKRHLHRTDAAALSRMAAKLFDSSEQFINVTGVFPQYPALQSKYKVSRTAVTHFAVSDKSLICVNFYNGTMHRSADNVHHS